MHTETYFLKIIKGEAGAVKNLFRSIQKDSRPCEVKIVSERAIDCHLLTNWAMARTDFDETELSFMPGIRTNLSEPEVINNYRG